MHVAYLDIYFTAFRPCFYPACRGKYEKKRRREKKRKTPVMSIRNRRGERKEEEAGTPVHAKSQPNIGPTPGGAWSTKSQKVRRE